MSKGSTDDGIRALKALAATAAVISTAVIILLLINRTSSPTLSFGKIKPNELIEYLNSSSGYIESAMQRDSLESAIISWLAQRIKADPPHYSNFIEEIIPTIPKASIGAAMFADYITNSSPELVKQLQIENEELKKQLKEKQEESVKVKMVHTPM